jgi:cell division protein FtsB
MAQENSTPSKRNSMVPILILLAAVYFGFLLYQSVYVNYQTNKKISELNKSLAEAEGEQENLKDLIAYYKTDTFQELEARKKLGLKLPGEKVVKVEVPKVATKEESSKPQTKSDNKRSNPELWLEFLFDQKI